jgi:hypothetical protein
MKKRFAILAGAVAGLVMLSQAAEAGPRRDNGARIGPYHVKNTRVFAAGVTAGAASSVGYWALVRDGGRHTWVPSGAAYGLTTVGCMAAAPILGAALVYATEGRELTSREAMGLGIGCLVPIVGPLLVEAAFDANPHWERQPPRGR